MVCRRWAIRKLWRDFPACRPYPPGSTARQNSSTGDWPYDILNVRSSNRDWRSNLLPPPGAGFAFPVTGERRRMTVDILFGQSYYLRFDPKLWEAMQPYPPLGTLYAAAYMRQRGYSVALFDAMLASGPEAWEATLQQSRPRFAVLFEDNFNYLSKMSLLRMREAAFAMLEAAKRLGCITIACGSDMTDHPEQ